MLLLKHAQAVNTSSKTPLCMSTTLQTAHEAENCAYADCVCERGPNAYHPPCFHRINRFVQVLPNLLLISPDNTCPTYSSRLVLPALLADIMYFRVVLFWSQSKDSLYTCTRFARWICVAVRLQQHALCPSTTAATQPAVVLQQ